MLTFFQFIAESVHPHFSCLLLACFLTSNPMHEGDECEYVTVKMWKLSSSTRREVGHGFFYSKAEQYSVMEE